MAAFTDTAGREWPVVLTIAAALRVEAITDFPATDLLHADTVAHAAGRLLFGDAATAIELVAVMIEPIAQARGVSLDDITFHRDDVAFALYSAIRARHQFAERNA